MINCVLVYNVLENGYKKYYMTLKGTEHPDDIIEFEGDFVACRRKLLELNSRIIIGINVDGSYKKMSYGSAENTYNYYAKIIIQ